jgi:uncharacterized membrane protein
MSIIKSKRIESIDILRGLVMVIMALDHARSYFHYGALFGDPTDLDTTTPFLFFTRFITHYCAPVFVFLAGTSAFLYRSNKTKKELSKFLFTRGIWLILLEIIVNNLIWTFDFSYSLNIFQVIWAIGLSMVFLSMIIYLPKKLSLIIGVLIVAGHNLLDGIVTAGMDPASILWYIFHQDIFLPLSSTKMVVFHYPVLPWIGTIILGYHFGRLYTKEFDAITRRKWLLRLGIGALLLFIILRGTNMYGNLLPWSTQKDSVYTFLSFMNVTKYPPSLSFLLITIGPSLLFLYVIEPIKNKATDFLLVFGRVPLFYYFAHVLVIHIFALGLHALLGGDWQDLVLRAQDFMTPKLLDYGYPLYVVYYVWILTIIVLYPFCKKYMQYKANNKDKWWLSYL